MRTKIILLSLCFLTFASISQTKNQGLAIVKTQDYTKFSFSKAVTGLFYPEFIDYEESYDNITIRVFNQTSEDMISKVTILKQFPSSCDFVLYDVDYGYYTKFPKFSIFGECSNNTVYLNYLIVLYRSGDWEISQGKLIQKSDDQKKCQVRPLQVNNVYSGSGFYRRIFRFCSKKEGQPLYRQYQFDSSKPKIYTQQNVSILMNLTNIGLVDTLLTVSPDRKFNSYLSENYGLILSNLNFTTYIWKVPDGEKPYRMQRLCWSNNFAVLTQGYIYFLQVDYLSNGTINFTVVKKSEKIAVQTTSKCDFFTIGHNAICSIYDGQDTTWYIAGGPDSPFNLQTQILKNQRFQPYISEELCSSNSFYQNNSRYQIYYNTVSETPVQLSSQQSKWKLKKSTIQILYGDIVGFMDAGSLFVVTRNSIANSSVQNQTFASYSKQQFDLNPKIVLTQTVSNNVTDLHFEYENIYRNGQVVPLISVIYSDFQAIHSNIQVFVPNSNSSQDYTLLVNFSMDLSVSNIGYLKNLQNSTQKFYYIISTPIERDAVARLFLTPSSFEFRYPYQFEASSFTMCSVTTTDNQLLFFRKDSTGITVLRAGFRFFKFLVLDGIFTIRQYMNYNIACAHDGLLLYNGNQIIILNSNLQVQYKYNGPTFDGVKHTKSLILTQLGNSVQVRQIRAGKLVGEFPWQLKDVVTNIHSTGFINKKEVAYYEFKNEGIQQQQI